MKDGEWVNGPRASWLMGCSPGHVKDLAEREGIRTKVEVVEGQRERTIYLATDVRRVAKARIDEGVEIGVLPPSAKAYLRALWNKGGTVEDRTGGGLATKKLYEGLAAQGYEHTTAGSSRSILVAAGLIETEGSGKRTYRIALTEAGLLWCAERFPAPPVAEASPPAVVEPEPEPTPPPEPPAPVVTNGSANGHGEQVDVDSLARAMLRQATRVLSDSDVATVMAERDALRAHNELLVDQVGLLRSERDRAAAEAREAREVLHAIEAQLTPLLVGAEARFDWLDARTRTDLINLVTKAAGWAAQP